MNYTLIGYESWGNKREGWEINNLWTIKENIQVAEDASNKEILKLMKKVGYFKKHVRLNMLDIWSDSEYFIEFFHRKTGEPLCRLELMDY